jgi:hypothetical protein
MKKRKPILFQFLSSYLFPSLMCVGIASTVQGQQVFPTQAVKTVATSQMGIAKSKIQPNINKASTVLWGTGASDTTSNSLGQFSNGFSTGTVSFNQWSAISINQSGGSVTPGNAYWVRNATGLGQGAYSGGETAFNPPSQSNGVALFDSDYLDNGGTAGAFNLGASPSRHKGELISPSFDLTGYTDSALSLNFYCQYRNFNFTDYSASISVDGGATWTTKSILAVNPPQRTTTAVELVFPSVTAGVTNLSNCKIKFTFDGDYYYAMIDDVSLTTANPYDLTIEKANPLGNSLTDAFKSVQLTHNAVIPIDQITGQGLRFGANVKNLGFASISPTNNAYLNFNLEIQTGSTWQSVGGGIKPISNIPVGGSTAIFDSLTSPFMFAGKYRITYTTFINGDANASNNSLTEYFEIVADNNWSKVDLNTNKLPVYDRPIFPGGTSFNRYEFGSVFSTKDGLILDSLAYNYYTTTSYIGTGSQVVKVYVYEWKDGVAGGTANRVVDDSRTSGELVIVGTGVDSLSGLFASGTYTQSMMNIKDANGNPVTLLPNSHYLVSLALEGTSFTSNTSIWFAASTAKNYAMNLGYSTGLVKSVSNLFLEDGSGSPSGTWLGFGADIVPSFGLYTSSLCNSFSAVISSTNNVTTHLGFNGSATVTPVGGTAPYTNLWSNSDGAATAVNLTAGNYSVTVTDANGCTATANTTITQPAAKIVINEISYNGPEIGSDTTEFIELYNNGSVAVDLTGYHFTQGVTYTFPSMTINAGGYVVVAFDSVAINNVYGVAARQWTTGGLSNGGEDVTLYDNFNMLVDSVNYDDSSPWPVGPPSPDGGGPSIELNNPNLDNNVGSNWSISYNLVTGQVVNGLQVFGTPGGANVTIPPIVLTTTIDSLPTCNGSANGGATIAATGGTPPFTYLWSFNNATTTSITGLSSGTYNVTVTDAASATATASAVITQPATLAVSATATSNYNGKNISCNGASDGEATATATGGTSPYNYFWNAASGSQTTAIATNLSAGNYSVIVSDVNGCTTSSSATIAATTVLSSSISATTNASCNGSSDGAATVAGSGGTSPYSYAWSNAATTASISNLTSGAYTVTVTDANGCFTASTATISAPTVLNSSITATTNVSCNGTGNGTATVAGSGGTSPYTYLWNTAAGSQTAATATTLPAGSYSVRVTDANGCTSSSSATITEPTVLFSSLASVNVSCNGGNNGTTTVNSSGGTSPYTYAWSNAATTISIANLTAGAYTVTVTDANGCSTTSTATIAEPTVLASSLTSTNVSCNGGNNGTTAANSTGGTTPYTYAWSNAATTASLSNLTAGAYTVTVTDGNGCTIVSSSTITEPVVLSGTIATTNVSCNGGSNGTAILTAAGGTTPYNYLWNAAAGSQTTATATGLAAGSYAVIVTDANGCTLSSSTAITEPTAIDTTVTNVNYILTANQSGATYQWLDCNNNNSPIAGAAMQSYSVLANGSYAVAITLNGCIDTSACVQIVNVGVNQLHLEKQTLKLFPNPNKGSFTVELTDKAMGGELQIYSISGKLLQSVTVNSEKQVIDATDLANGVYFIRLQNEAIRFIIAH